MLNKIYYRLHILGNLVALLIVCAVLGVAYYEQFAGSQLPCPLCFLQRVGYAAMGAALCLNLVKGPKPFNYGLFIISAAFLMTVAGRQVLLHILPGDKGFGDPVMGLFPYSWNVVVAFCFILIAAVALMFQRGFMYIEHRMCTLSKILVVVFILLLASNCVMAFLECGLGACPDNPVSYKYLIK